MFFFMKLICIVHILSSSQPSGIETSIDIFVNCYFSSPFSTQSVHFNHVGFTDIKAIQCPSVWWVVIWRVRKLCSLLFYNDKINEFIFYSVFFVNYSGILTCFSGVFILVNWKCLGSCVNSSWLNIVVLVNTIIVKNCSWNFALNMIFCSELSSAVMGFPNLF